MSDREQSSNPSSDTPTSGSTSSDPPPESSSGTPSNPSGAAPVVEVCFFRYASLLHIPEHWRGAFRNLGETIHDVTLEIWGLAPEAPDSLTTTLKRLQALADDLFTTGEQLEELAAEPEGAHLVPAEVRLCRLAGRLARQVKELARQLAAVG